MRWPALCTVILSVAAAGQRVSDAERSPNLWIQCDSVKPPHNIEEISPPLVAKASGSRAWTRMQSVSDQGLA